jgi:putative acetyltransferase
VEGAGVISLRDGVIEDAPALVAVEKEASLAAFPHVFPPELYPYPDAAVLEDLLARIATGTEVIVAEDGGEAVGWVSVSPGWLEQLYVLPTFWGTGVGPLLHDAAVDRRHAAGDGELRLWTLEANTRSRRFYERRGWALDGHTRVVPFPPHPLDVGYTLRIESC